MQRNAFKHNLAAGKLQIGLWSSLCSNVAAEIIGDSGFDWILLDTEHSPNELDMVLCQLQAAKGGTASAVVRPAMRMSSPARFDVVRFAYPLRHG